MKITNKLNHRFLSIDAKIVICDFVTGEINYTEAHNKLLNFGIYLTEDGRLLDY